MQIEKFKEVSSKVFKKKKILKKNKFCKIYNIKLRLLLKKPQKYIPKLEKQVIKKYYIKIL